jgi:hypothetical protein
MTMIDAGQLTFNIAPHPSAASRPGGLPVMGASLAIKGALAIEEDLNHGDALTVTIANADGEIIATAQLEVAAPPSFVPIEDKDLGLLGYERAHKAKAV